MPREIDDILNAYHYKTLQDMAEEAGIATADLRKADLVARMKAEYFAEKRVRASLEKLGKREQAVLNRLLLHGGEATSQSFQRELIRADLVAETPELKIDRSQYYYSGVPYDRGVYTGDPRRRDSRIFEDVIARLTFYGLAFSRGTSATSSGAHYKVQFHPADVVYVPQAIRSYLPEPEPIPPPLADWEPDRIETGTPTLLLRDLYLYWDFARRNDVKLIQSGFVGKRPLKAINEILLVSDALLQHVSREDSTDRLYLLRRLLESLGLVCKEKGYLRSTDEDPLGVPAFWSWDQVRQLEAVLGAWSKIGAFKELGNEAEAYSPRYVHAHQMVRHTLREFSPDTWVEPAQLLDKIRVRDRDFLFAGRRELDGHQSRYYSYYGGHYYGSKRKLLQTLEGLEIAFVNRCLTGFLHQVGVVELGYEGDTLRAFRLSQAMLDREAPERASSQPRRAGGRLIVQPTFELMAMGPVSLAMLAKLDLFAERQRADQAVFEYRLSRESIYDAQRKGLDVVEVIHFLEQTSDTDVPQNVRRSLEEWGAHYERITFRMGVSLMQTTDADLLETLLNDPQIGPHLFRSVAPEIALIKDNQQSQLIAALVEQGRLPATSDGRPESADGSVIVQKDGSIHPVHAVPTLHLCRRLSRLAEESSDGVWRLTPASIRRSGGTKRKVVDLLKELSKLHRSSLPEELVERIKAEGGYYGSAAAETLTLIEFRDHATLNELQEHPQLREIVTPFAAGDRALAVVPTEKLPQVKDILADFGVHTEDGLRGA